MCSIWERADNNEMNMEQMKHVFLKLKKSGIYGVYIQGGEPLLYPKIKETLLFLKEHFDIRLISNGIGLNTEMQNFIIKNNIGLTISLDTLDRERYKKIRGVDAFDVVIRNIKSLSEKDYKNVSIHSTISSLNKDELFKLREFSYENGFEFSALPYISNIGFAGKANEGLSYERESLITVFKKLEKAEHSSNYILSLVYSDVIDFLSGKEIGPCDALAYSIYLTQEGLISPCLEKKPYLDLKTQPFDKILADKTQKKIVQNCYTQTPCYYGCAREIHALSKNWKTILMNPVASLDSIKKYLKMKE